MITYKGTDKNMQCRGFQYEIGKEYEDDGSIRCGSKGFHSCKAPLDVFRYYAPGDGSKYFVCDADGDIDEGNNDTKIASSKLTLKASLSIPALVKAQIEYVKSKATGEEKRTGDSGVSSAGYRGVSSAGDSGVSSAGYRGVSSAGDSGVSSAGDSGVSSAGDSGVSSAGDRGVSSAGYSGVSSAGDSGVSSARGKVSVGKNGVGTVRGNGVMIRGGLGALLVIAEENDDDYNIKEWKAVVVDDEIIKADTWYKLDHGDLVIAEEEME